jgi:hypothetical protein
MRLYLVPNAVAAEVRTRFDPRLHFIGTIVPDARGRGLLSVALPALDADSYAAAVWCPRCARYSRGRTFFVLRVNQSVAARYRPLMLLRIEKHKTCALTTPSSGRRYGNGLLSTQLSPGGVVPARVEPDGSLFWKFSWTPAARERELSVRGERLDVPSPPMRVLGVNWGYSSSQPDRGGWATAVQFPTEGCWRITGRMRDVSLTFVVRVVRG